jgi:anti-anti-sigma factor
LSRESSFPLSLKEVVALRLSTETIGDTPVLHIEGDVDPDDARLLEGAAWEALGRDGTKIILDLEGCTHITSAGLAVLFSLSRWAISKNGRLIAARPSPDILRLLQLVRLTSEHGFQVVAEIDRAI